MARVSTLLTTVGLPNRPSSAGIGGFARTMPALALEALQHRGLLAADVRAGADADVQVEGEAGAEDRSPEPAVLAGDLDRGAHRGDGVGVLGADVDVALGRADGVRGDRHALDERNGSPSISMRSANVPQSPSSALQQTNFSVRRRVRARSST